jgi:CubicO group peptidase (beta-lactamase class C family)
MHDGLTRRDVAGLMIGAPLAAASGASAAAREPSLASREIDGLLVAAKPLLGIPGLVAVATTRDRILYHRAFGQADIVTGSPMTEDAMFRIASMTKPIASLALMRLVEQKRFTLDDPVEKYLPEFADLKVFESFDHTTGAYRVRPARKSVTVRDLLVHTSGIAYNFTSPIVRDFKPREGECYPVGPLLFEPGERWYYGTSTDWVGRLVEVVSGKTLDAYFREHIFAPLKMMDTHYSIPSEKQSRMVAVHSRRPDGSVEKDANQPPFVLRTTPGSTGLSSTADDYIRFLRMYLNEGVFDGVRIVSAETIAEMSRNQIGTLSATALKTALPERSNDFSFIADGKDKWGLGFLIAAADTPGGPSAGSLSWGGLFNTYFWIDRTHGIAGVILMQFLPFADPKALTLYANFKRGVYRLADSP